MSSITNCYNHSNNATLSEYDNVNEYDLSLNRQNESMMHKVKDVVSKFFNPSFLFTASPDTDQSKRKRSISVEDEDEESTTTVLITNAQKTTAKVQPLNQSVRNDEIELTDDDEDKNTRQRPSNEREQQKKRRRTGNYQQTDAASVLPNTTPIIRTSMEENYQDRIHRLTASKQRFNIPSTYRESTSTYDPSKSPLFVDRKANQTTTTTTAANVKSNDFSANYLLATSLVNRSQPLTPKSQQVSATLTNPKRTLPNDRQITGVNYSSINSRRLPYIERLRRRTLQDCIRLNRTLDNEPLSESTIEERQSMAIIPVSKQIKALEKECGIQCDISIFDDAKDMNKRTPSKFPPNQIQYEAPAMAIEKSQSSTQTDSSSMETNSSITIEKLPPKIDITKPKVLGDITPFSWPKFARAQDEYAKKHPEKCTDTLPPKSVASSVMQQSHVAKNVPLFQQPNTHKTVSVSPSSSSGSTWKCNLCTKENPLQATSCSLCHNINANYKKSSATVPSVSNTIDPVTSKEIPITVSKESSLPKLFTTPTTTTNQTTRKETDLSIPSVTTTSTSSFTLPLFSTTPTTSKDSTVMNTFPLATSQFPKESSKLSTTKESLITTPTTQKPTFVFGTTSTSQESPQITIGQSDTAASLVPPVTKESSAIANASANVAASSVPPVTKENPVAFSTFQFGVTSSFVPPTIKENPVAFSTFRFGTTASLVPTISKETPATTSSSSTLPPFATTISFTTPSTTKESSEITTTFSVTPVCSTVTTTGNAVTTTTNTFGTTTLNTSTISSSSTPFQSSMTFPPFSSMPTPTISATTISGGTVTPMSSSPASTPGPFSGSFGNNSQTATVSFSSNQPASASITMPTTSSTLFGFSTITPAPATSATSSSFTTFSAPASVPFGTNTGSFNFGSNSTATQSNSQLAFGAPSASSSSFSALSSNSSLPFAQASPFGVTTVLPDKSTNVPSTFMSNPSPNPPVQFNFGSISNAATSTIQNASAATPSTGGFGFPSQQLTGQAFGSVSSPLSSVVSSSPFNFSITPTAPTNTALFQSSVTSSPIFPNNSSFNSASDASNPFDIHASDATSKRSILKPKRRLPRP